MLGENISTCRQHTAAAAELCWKKKYKKQSLVCWNPENLENINGTHEKKSNSELYKTEKFKRVSSSNFLDILVSNSEMKVRT